MFIFKLFENIRAPIAFDHLMLCRKTAIPFLSSL